MTEPIPVEALGQVMLLESFIDQASRHAIAKLTLRMRLGRLQERRHEALSSGKENRKAHGSHSSLVDILDTDFSKVRQELSGLDPRLQSTFSIVDKLRLRTGANEPSEGLRVRSRIYELLCICFSDILPGSIARESKVDQRRTAKTDKFGGVRSVSLAAYDPAKVGPEKHALWSLVRPCRAPRVVVQLFLGLSAQVAQLQRNHYDPLMTLSVGKIWYSLLSDLLVQLGLSASVFKEYTPAQALAALDLVDPDAEDRETLYPALWKKLTSEDSSVTADFDRDWREIRKAVQALDSTNTATELLADRSSPHAFCNKLLKYFEAVLDHLEPPTLDVYNRIRQTGKFPQGFFETPDQLVDLPSHPQLISDNDDTEKVDDMALLDPFSPRAPFSAPRTSAFASVDLAADDANQSPSERVAQAQAYNAMTMSAKRPANAPLATWSGDDSSPASPTEDVLMQRAKSAARDRRASSSLLVNKQRSLATEDDSDDVEMSPSQHASVKRQKSSDLMANVHDLTPRKAYEDAPMVGDDDMNIEDTVAADSPSALLSARHDRRARDSVRNTQVPPPTLDFTPNHSLATADLDDGPSLHGPSPTSSAMTTPKSQTGGLSRVEKPKYVSDWVQGDVEGGGRPHRRRHDPTALGGTPDTSRTGSLPPPPQTLLSPKNIAAAQRKNIRLETLIAESETTVDMPGRSMNTPERGKIAEDPLAQVTPEHQIGLAADARTRSASRYVIRKDQGDIEGGGRKHRKRQRSGQEPLNMDI